MARKAKTQPVKAVAFLNKAKALGLDLSLKVWVFGKQPGTVATLLRGLALFAVLTTAGHYFAMAGLTAKALEVLVKVWVLGTLFDLLVNK